jgi:hypothetical protein
MTAQHGLAPFQASIPQHFGLRIAPERPIMDVGSASRLASALLLLATGVLGCRPNNAARGHTACLTSGGAYYRRGDGRWQIRS